MTQLSNRILLFLFICIRVLIISSLRGFNGKSPSQLILEKTSTPGFDIQNISFSTFQNPNTVKMQSVSGKQISSFDVASNDTEKEHHTSPNRLPGHLTVHAAHIAETHNVPMHVLIRPIPSVLDENKVQSLMDTIENKGTANSVPPIDILWVTGEQGGDYYFSFGGCHRYEAYKRLNRKTIPCKLVKSTVKDIQVYLGGSMPNLL